MAVGELDYALACFVSCFPHKFVQISADKDWAASGNKSEENTQKCATAKMRRYTGKFRATGKFEKLYGNFLAGQRWVDGGLQISIVKVKQRKASQANIMLRFLRRWALYKYSIDAQYLSYICRNTTYFSKYNLEHGGNMKQKHPKTQCAQIGKKNLQIQFRARRSCWAASLKVSPKTGSFFSPPSVFFYRDQHDVYIDYDTNADKNIYKRQIRI